MKIKISNYFFFLVLACLQFVFVPLLQAQLEEIPLSNNPVLQKKNTSKRTNHLATFKIYLPMEASTNFVRLIMSTSLTQTPSFLILVVRYCRARSPWKEDASYTSIPGHDLLKSFACKCAIQMPFVPIMK